MKKIAVILLVGALLLSICCLGCAHEKNASVSFFLMDTVITVTLYIEPGERADEIFLQSRRILEDFDALWSRHKPNSEVACFNQSKEASMRLDGRTAALLQKAMQISQDTNRTFDITMAPISDLWQRCGEENRLPTDAELQVLLSHTGIDKLILADGVLSKADADLAIDLGGIGKGAAIEALRDYLCACDLPGGLITFGSNVAVFGEKENGEAFRIALRDPKNSNGTLGTLRLEDGEILSVSGDYERYVTIEGVRYHHILDAATGYPAQSGLSSVAVVCRDGAVADALSTALLVMGQEKAMAFYENSPYQFEAILTLLDGTTLTTPGLMGRFVANAA